MPAPKLEFVSFIIKLAANRKKLKAFLDDPGKVARAARLSRSQVDALVSGGEAELNELVRTDLSEWLLVSFQGAPFRTSASRKGGKKGRKKAAKKRASK